MTKNLIKDFLREIRHSLNRFISILCIVAIGVAFFAGLKSSAPDMKYTMDDYYDQFNIMDIQVVSTLGLTEEDIEEIAAVDGVAHVQPGWFADALANVYGSEMIFRIHSLPEDLTAEETINKIEVVEGRLPEAPGEIVVEDSQNMDTGLKIGDTLTFTSGTDTPITDGTLTQDTYTVVGKVITPYYLTFDKGNSQIGGKAISLFAYIPAENFDYEDVYVEALVTVEGARELNAFDKDYTRLVSDVANTLSNLGADRSVLRGDELRDQANQQLDEAQEEYNTQLADFNSQISEAQEQLDSAYTQLIQGEADYKTGMETYETEIAEAEQQIEDGESQLAMLKEALATGRDQVNTAQSAYDSAMEQSEEYLEMLDSLENLMKIATDGMASIGELLEDLRNDPDADEGTLEQYEQLYAYYEQMYNAANEEYQQLKTLNSDLDTLINEADSALKDAKTQLDELESQYNSALRQLNAGKAELEKQRTEGKAQLEEARATLDQGWEDYNAGKDELELRQAEGQIKLDQANEQLIAARYEIEKIQNAEWYMLDRSTNYGFASYKSTVENMDALSQIMPVFFILVAVLVCMTTMTRMVSEDRGHIGTYKALGYENNAIAAKYVLYVVAASVLGGVIGAALGVRLFPQAVYDAWAAMYRQPALKQTLQVGVILVSFLATVVAMACTAYYTCRSELISVPAQLMRPKAPKMGKTILVERIPFIWRRLNFSQKVTMRNIFRYKKRLFMTVIGIMGCTALLLSGLGMNDTIGTVVANQYEKIFHYNVTLTTTDELSDEDWQTIEGVLADSGVVAQYGELGATTVNMTVENSTETATLYVAENGDMLDDYILLQNRSSRQKLALDDSGVVISEKLARQLGVSVGDTVNLVNAENMKKAVPVSGITENYVFHYAYMSKAAYESYFWQGVPENTTLITLSDGCTADQEQALLEALDDTNGVVSVVSFTDVADSFKEQISALSSIILLIIICAALLAFVVLYNLTNINVSERIREIATIKVLGFKGGEVAMYVYREIFMLSLMGAVIGLALGVGLHRIIMQSIEQSNIMFGYVISPWSFLWALVLTCVFTLAVMAYMYHKLVNIPMVESLKSVE